MTILRRLVQWLFQNSGWSGREFVCILLSGLFRLLHLSWYDNIGSENVLRLSLDTQLNTYTVSKRRNISLQKNSLQLNLEFSQSFSPIRTNLAFLSLGIFLYLNNLIGLRIRKQIGIQDCLWILWRVWWGDKYLLTLKLDLTRCFDVLWSFYCVPKCIA